MKSKMYMNFERLEEVEFHSIEVLVTLTSNSDNIRDHKCGFVVSVTNF